MMSNERKAKFEEVWKRYEVEAKDAKARAIKAKADLRKSDFGFWMDVYETAKERAEHFYSEYLNA